MFSPQTSFGAPTPPTPPSSPVRPPALPFGYFPEMFPLVAEEALERLRQLEKDFAESNLNIAVILLQYTMDSFTHILQLILSCDLYFIIMYLDLHSIML